MTYNKNFLCRLDQHRNKTIYAKITALTFEEYPIETIEGRVSQGSINLDGDSSIRRTCSLTIIAQNFDYSNYYWGLNTKFKLEIGVSNEVDKSYPDIIWFNQGIYLISSFNMAKSTNNFSITIQGKDKMAMLNGEAGGVINSSVDFGTIEEEDQNGNWTIRKIPIREIIANIVHTYGGEPSHKIIINDLPDYGLELLEYRYETPMYLYRLQNSANYTNATLDGGILCMREGESEKIKFSDLTPNDLETLVDPFTGSTNPTPIQFDNDDNKYIIAKIEYGQTAGYRKTPLIYAGDLIANIGESVVSVLDKIKNMLGEFEYFYDLDGRFVFQKKLSYVNTLYSPINNDGSIENLSTQTAIQYVFNGGELITQFNNNPNLLNLKNDYSIWGQRTTVSGAQVPVHLRYAIDTKPKSYTQVWTEEEENKAIEIYNNKNNTVLTGRSKKSAITFSTQQYESNKIVDWREIIYQMALDYYKYGHLDNFELMLRRANPQTYPMGKTGYEQYYIDMQDLWRQLYNPELDERIQEQTLQTELLNYKYQVAKEKYDIYSKDQNISLSNLEVLKLNYEDLELQLNDAKAELEDLKSNQENYYYGLNDLHRYWNKQVYEQPEVLNFWFDFLDTEGTISKFNVKAIGSRQKATNDTNIKSIYFKETPNILFVDNILDVNDQNQSSAYTYIQVPEILHMFSVSAQGKSAKTVLDEQLYTYSYRTEGATINCIPIYYLQPNTRVHLSDKETNIIGDYIISKISIPLTYNGPMSLTTTKAAEAINIELSVD